MPAFLDAHLDRLFEGAHKIALDLKMTPKPRSRRRLYEPLDANQMSDGVPRAHDGDARLEEGGQSGSAQCARPATVVIVAEYKQPSPISPTRSTLGAQHSLHAGAHGRHRVILA